MAPKKIKDLALNGRQAPAAFEIGNEYNEFIALLNNAVKVLNTSYPSAQRIKTLLINNNYVCYDGLLKEWVAAVPGAERNILNLPTSAIITLPTGQQFERKLSYEPKAAGAFLIKGLPADITYSEIIRRSTCLMQECDMAILQNIRAVKAPYWIVVKDENTRLSVEHAIQQQQQGNPVIVVTNDIYDGIKGQQIATPVIFNDIFIFRQKIRDNLLNKLSTLTTNRDKLERVQSAEVGATVGECEDYIYALIDNFNNQAETYGLPERLALNSSLEELYTITQSTAETNNNEVIGDDQY